MVLNQGSGARGLNQGLGARGQGSGNLSPDSSSLTPDPQPLPPLSSLTPPSVVRLQLVGANPAATVRGLERQRGTVNYFLGNDPAQWHTHVATFGRVQYDQVYPGIGLVYYGRQQQLEYDFVVAPGADPSAIRLNVSGAERLEVDGGGDLVVQAGGQEL